MQSSKKQQGKMRKTSSVINEKKKKKRKTTEWGRQGISSRKLKIPREHFMQRQVQIQDRNDMDLTEAEDIKKWWLEFTEKLYKKDVHGPDNHYGVIPNLK